MKALPIRKRRRSGLQGSQTRSILRFRKKRSKAALTLPAVGLAARSGLQMMPGQKGVVGVAGVLAAPIRMHHQNHRRLALGNGHPQARFFHGTLETVICSNLLAYDG